ncbi:MAG: ribosome maturation factor RimM [Bacteroidia bacterium]
MMTREDCVLLGYINKPHGLKGEVKFAYDVQNIQEYVDVKTIYLAKAGMPLEKMKISRLNPHANSVGIVKFVGVNTRWEADELIGSEVYFPLERLPKLEDGQVFYFELLGFEVSDQNHGVIGKIRDIFETGAEDLLAVDTPEGKEVLIPFQKPIYQEIDKEAKTVHVNLPDGLLELYVGE